MELDEEDQLIPYEEYSGPAARNLRTEMANVFLRHLELVYYFYLPCLPTPEKLGHGEASPICTPQLDARSYPQHLG